MTLPIKISICREYIKFIYLYGIIMRYGQKNGCMYCMYAMNQCVIYETNNCPDVITPGPLDIR